MPTCQRGGPLLGFSGGMPRMGSLRPRTVAKPSSPLELVNSTLSTSHTPDMHSVIFCVSAEYLQPACEQRGEPPLARAGARFEAPFEARFKARFDVGQRA